MLHPSGSESSHRGATAKSHSRTGTLSSQDDDDEEGQDNEEEEGPDQDEDDEEGQDQDDNDDDDEEGQEQDDEDQGYDKIESSQLSNAPPPTQPSQRPRRSHRPPERHRSGTDALGKAKAK